MSLLITGSIATDHLMSFPGRFADSLVVDKLDKLALSFLVDDLEVRRGGCAANICFGLGNLGLRPVLVGAVGEIDRGGAVRRTPEIRAFTASWQTVSSDLATLTGAINDNLPDYQRLARTNRLAPTPGGTFALLPWVELALGVAAVGAVLALRRKVGP